MARTRRDSSPFWTWPQWSDDVPGIIEVPGKWVFGQDSIAFVFEDGQSLDFGAIQDMKTFRAALVTTAKVGTDVYLESILGNEPKVKMQAAASQPAATSRVTGVQDRFNSVLERAEASFREQEKRAEESIKRAQADYEAATANVIGGAGTPGA